MANSPMPTERHRTSMFFLRLIGLVELMGGLISFGLLYSERLGGGDIWGVCVFGSFLVLVGLAYAFGRKSGGFGTAFFSFFYIVFVSTSFANEMPASAFIPISLLFSIPLFLVIRCWNDLRSW